MIDYVCGFMFDESREYVLLIEKNRPDWQAGKLNAIGGHIEKDENPENAMVREFVEETGIQTDLNDWKFFCGMNGNGYTIRFYKSIGDIAQAESITDEKVKVCAVKHLPNNIIQNLSWLINLALDDQIESAYARNIK